MWSDSWRISRRNVNHPVLAPEDWIIRTTLRLILTTLISEKSNILPRFESLYVSTDQTHGYDSPTVQEQSVDS